MPSSSSITDLRDTQVLVIREHIEKKDLNSILQYVFNDDKVKQIEQLEVIIHASRIEILAAIARQQIMDTQFFQITVNADDKASYLAIYTLLKDREECGLLDPDEVEGGIIPEPITKKAKSLYTDYAGEFCRESINKANFVKDVTEMIKKSI